MKNSQKAFANISVIVLLLIIMGVSGYFVLVKKSPASPSEILPANNLPVATFSTPLLSVDKKSIDADANLLLAIDDNTIFNWFKNKSQLCDEVNIASASDRKAFCENKISFKNQTRFASITVSPDTMKIGFTIESDTLAPDSVVGIFSRTTNTTTLLGNYYLGNKFIGFSPNGTNFVYVGGCFEGMCGLYVKNSETLAEKANLSDAESADARTRTTTFVKWISDNEIEYKLGTELKRVSF